MRPCSLEQVEDIIFNLCEGVEVRETEARVEAYRREHAGEIAKLNQRHADEERLRSLSTSTAPGSVDTWSGLANTS